MLIAGPLRRVRRRVLSAMNSEGDCTAGSESSRILRGRGFRSLSKAFDKERYAKVEVMCSFPVEQVKTDVGNRGANRLVHCVARLRLSRLSATEQGAARGFSGLRLHR